MSNEPRCGRFPLSQGTPASGRFIQRVTCPHRGGWRLPLPPRQPRPRRRFRRPPAGGARTRAGCPRRRLSGAPERSAVLGRPRPVPAPGRCPCPRPRPRLPPSAGPARPGRVSEGGTRRRGPAAHAGPAAGSARCHKGAARGCRRLGRRAQEPGSPGELPTVPAAPAPSAPPAPQYVPAARAEGLLPLPPPRGRGPGPSPPSPHSDS